MTRSLPDRACRLQSDRDIAVGRAEHGAGEDRAQPWSDVLLPDHDVQGGQHEEEKAQDVLDEEEEEAVGDVDLGDDQVEGIGEEADDREAGDEDHGGLLRGGRQWGAAETKWRGEEEEEGADAGWEEQGDGEGDVVEEVVEPRLHRAHSQLLLPRRSDRHNLLAKSRVHVVQHLDAENLKDDTMKACSRNIDVGDGESGDYGGVRKVFRQDLNW